jgi:phosphatidylserine/phosphatidylglycerophosphate/cardiolipin synthase-like enzyme
MLRIFAAALLISAPVLADELPPIFTDGDATVCFTTGRGSTIGADCAALTVQEIGKATKTLLVQAYNFTEPHIIAAIVDAHARGVAVTVLLDKSVPTEKNGGAQRLLAGGIPTFIDRRPAIAHNKVMVIDGETVLTGSFNWTTAAENSNAENLLVVRRPALAAAYAENFRRRQTVSVPYDGTH